MRGDCGIYLNFVNGNHYQAVFSIEQQMPTIPVANPMQSNPGSFQMQPIPSIPIVVPNFLSKYVSTAAVSSSIGAMSASKLATVLSSASITSLQKRARGRPPKNPRMFYTYLL